MIVEGNSKPHDIVIYTDGSVTRDGSAWALTVKQDGKTVHEDSGAHRVTTCILTMEVEVVTHAMQWLASQRYAQITDAIIVTDSVNLPQKVQCGTGCPRWHTAMHSVRLQRLVWMYCGGQAGVSGTKRADRLASSADMTCGLQLGRAEVLGGLRKFVKMDRREHESTDGVKGRGMEKGSGGHCSLQCLFVVGCLTSQQQAIVYLRDGSAQTILRAATLRYKLQIQRSTSPSHGILTPGRPVPALTL